MGGIAWGGGLQLSKLLGLGCGKPRVLLGTWGPTDDGGIWQGAWLGPISWVCPGVPAPWELLSVAGGWDRCLAADWALASGPTPEIAPEMTTSSTWRLVPSLCPWVLARLPGGLGFGLMGGWGCLEVCLLWLGSIGPFLWSKGPYHYPRRPQITVEEFISLVTGQLNTEWLPVISRTEAPDGGASGASQWAQVGNNIVGRLCRVHMPNVIYCLWLGLLGSHYILKLLASHVCIATIMFIYGISIQPSFECISWNRPRFYGLAVSISWDQMFNWHYLISRYATS